jgi:hypothetical protein
MLYSHIVQAESRSTVKMDNLDIGRASIPFPVTGSDLVSDLERILVAETKIADNALVGSLQNYIVGIFENWFPGGNPGLVKVLKRLTNSLSATGSVPESNTRKALEEIDGWKSSQVSLTIDKALELLRTGTKDFRQARAFLFHQSKCVNGVIGFLAESKSFKPADLKKLNQELQTYKELETWADVMSEVFIRSRGGDKNLKNAKMYAGLWQRFIAIICDNAGEQDHPYSQFLAGRVREYLDKTAGSNFEQALTSNFSDQKLMTRSVSEIKSQSRPDTMTEDGLPIEIKISSGLVTLIFTLPASSESSVDRTLSELTFDFATKKQFSDLGISLQLQKTGPLHLLVSIANMDSVADIEQVKRYVSKKIAE